MAEVAVEHATHYLRVVGRRSELYREALEPSDSAEEMLRVADAERRRVERERQAAEAPRRGAARADGGAPPRR